MAAYCVNSEYRPLKAVMVCKPPPGIENAVNPEDVLHTHKINYSILEKEYEEIIKTYRKLKIKVYSLNLPELSAVDDRYIFNLMFTRDLFFMTPRGAIISRMGTSIRRDEVIYAQRALEQAGIRIKKHIDDDATFEGADALWVNGGLVAVGIGKRTNAKGFEQVSNALRRLGVRCVCLPAPKESLHLLGAVQFVDSDLALVRTDLIDSQVVNFLKENNIRSISVPESAEVITKFAMNFVIVAPRLIIIPADCHQTKKLYEQAGITIAAEVRITQLVNGGGGLACATGVLARE